MRVFHPLLFFLYLSKDSSAVRHQHSLVLAHPCRAAPQAGRNAVTQHLPAPNRQRHGPAGIGGVVEHTQRLPCRTIAPLCRKEPAHQRLLQREKVQGIRRVGVGAGKPRKPCPQRQQAAVVVHQCMVFFGPLPVQPVQRRRRAVAVALPFLVRANSSPACRKGRPKLVR